MYESELYSSAKSALESCLGVRQVFALMPAGTEVSVLLDDRIPCTLVCSNESVSLEPRKTNSADFEVILFSESVRRLSESQPSHAPALISELGQLILIGKVKIVPLSSPRTLYNKGYLTALWSIVPELQKDFSKIAITAMMQTSKIVEDLKSRFSRNSKSS